MIFGSLPVLNRQAEFPNHLKRAVWRGQSPAESDLACREPFDVVSCATVVLERCSKDADFWAGNHQKRLAEGGKRNGLAAFWAEYGALQL
jgi:hypothetical protein